MSLTLSIVIAFATRLALVALFFPFSAIDKVLEARNAVDQAQETFAWRPLAVAAIAAGFTIEVVMSLCVLSGRYDRLAALVLAGYCVATACLWKRFWEPGDFWAPGKSVARESFWDFLKNVAVAGGFLLVTFGTTSQSVHAFLDDPLSSTHPYSTTSTP